MKAVQLFNTAFIDISLLCVFLSIRKLKSRKSALFFLLFCALTPFSYVWTLYYYTSTTSMAFACVAIYLWLCIRDTPSRVKSCLLAAILGILCITGFKVRATSLIAYIAIFLFWTMGLSRNRLKNKALRKANVKRYLPPLAVFLFTAALAFLGWKGIVNHYAPFDTTDTAFPVTHFMMMGSRWDGSFNEADRLYTASLPTAEAKMEGTLSVIKERLTEAGPAGILKLLLAKQLNVWQEGTDLARYEFSLSTDFHLLHSLIMGSRNTWFVEFSQMLRVLELFLVCISCIFALLRRKADGIFLLTLNLLGGMAFHLLWETSPAYSIPFTFFFFALVCDGMEHLAGLSLFRKKSGAGLLLGASTGLILVTCAALVLNFKPVCAEAREADDYVVHQPMFDSTTTAPVIAEGETWRQSFTSDTPFNVWHLFIGSSHATENTSAYQITLSDEYGTVYYDAPLYGYESGYEGYVEFGTELTKPQGRTTYYIDIQVLYQDEDNYIHFNSLSETLADMYPYGTLTIDGEEVDRDLSIRILERHITPLATKKEYCALAILLIFMELFLVFRSFRLVKASGLVH